MGSRDGAVVKTLASHQCGPGSIPARCHKWVEFVVGSCLVPRVFLWVLQFFSLYKNQHSKFQLYQDIKDPYENQLRLIWLPLSK